MAIFLGHPTITVGFYIWKSMIPAALGKPFHVPLTSLKN